MSGRISRLKRRDPDDLVLDLQNVSLSPSKKLRFSESGVSGIGESGSIFTAAKPGEGTPFSLLKGPSAPALSASTPTKPLRADAVLSPPLPASEQRALVLYRPLNSPLFPGGPPSGSVDLPISIRMNTSMLPIPQGTDTGCDSSCFQTTSSDLASQSPFSNDKDTPSGHGLFQALDLSGGPIAFPGQKRLTRNSSCPRFSVAADDQSMIEDIDEKSEEQLAVIPWVPNSSAPLLAGRKPITEDVAEGAFYVPDAEGMADGDSMEVVNEISVPEVDTSTMGGQFGSPLPSFTSAAWQQCETLQPPFTTVMWSH